MNKTAKNPGADGYQEDRRNSLRYLITGAVWFEWQAADGEWHHAIGITRNIGKAGLFIESESTPPVGSTLRLSVALPTRWSSDTTVRLGGSGHVCHIRRGPPQPDGFGASSVFHVGAPSPKQEPEQLW
jgi:hypothetical protein